MPPLPVKAEADTSFSSPAKTQTEIEVDYQFLLSITRSSGRESRALNRRAHHLARRSASLLRRLKKFARNLPGNQATPSPPLSHGPYYPKTVVAEEVRVAQASGYLPSLRPSRASLALNGPETAYEAEQQMPGGRYPTILHSGSDSLSSSTPPLVALVSVRISFLRF